MQKLRVVFPWIYLILGATSSTSLADGVKRCQIWGTNVIAESPYFVAQEELIGALEHLKGPIPDEEMAIFRERSKIHARLKASAAEKLVKLELRKKVIAQIESFHLLHIKHLTERMQISEESVNELARVQYFMHRPTSDLSKDFSWRQLLTLEQIEGYLNLYKSTQTELGEDQLSPAQPGNLTIKQRQNWEQVLEKLNIGQLNYYHLIPSILKNEKPSYRLGFRDRCCRGGCTVCPWGYPELLSTALSLRGEN